MKLRIVLSLFVFCWFLSASKAESGGIAGKVVVRCEIHSGMKAYIVVLETPYFTVPNSTGAISLVDVPAGTYNLEAWHPNQRTKQQTITVPESGIVNVDISF